MAEQRSLEINVISAKDLQDVNLVTKMDVYAVVSISGDPNSRQKVKTDVDRGCGTHPTWNFPVKLSVDESLAQSNRLTLVFRLVCDRSLGDKDVGEVIVPVKELLDSVNAAGEGSSCGGGGGLPMKFVSYQVRKPSGKAKGELNFSYRFGQKAAGKIAAGEPVKESPACPAAAGSLYPPPPVVAYDHAHGPPPITGYAAAYAPPPAQPPPYGGVTYPPPPTGYGYGYAPPPPPPPGYAYGYQVPPPPPGYGYAPPPPVAPPRNNKSKFGLGLGAGLVGGVLGGMLIGDVVSDVASYDAGYDAGFGDVGGFGF